MRIKGIKNPVSYKRQMVFIRTVCVLLIMGACLTVGTNTILLQAAHQTVTSKTDHYISELSKSTRNALQDRFQRTLMSLESVARSCDLETTLSAEELKELQDQAELLQFKYFAFVSPDGSAICSDGISRTFDWQDGIMKAFDGQTVIDVTTLAAESDTQNGELPLFAVPVYSQKGTEEIIGVLAAPILPEWTDFFLTQSYYDENVFLDIIRSDGTEIFMAERSHISWFDELQDFDSANNLFDILYANIKIIGDTSIDDLRKAAATGHDETIRFYPQNDHLIYTAQLTHIGGTDLCIWMVDSNDAISEGLHQIIHKASAVNVLATICFIVLIVALVFLYRKNMLILMTDPVTRGYSSTRFMQEAERLIQHSTPGEYTLVVMNTVNFKLFNDIYGYDESDRILKHIHDTILKYMERGELLGRSSADDFNILIRTTSREVIIQKLDLIVDEINQFNNGLREKQWLMFRMGVYQIVDTTMSVVNIRDRTNIARKKMIIPAEGILYCCGFYEEEDRARLKQENLLINKMEDALKNRDFKLYLQPKVDISTGKIINAEALVRWKDRDMGLVPPDEFIPLFERIGFIRRLDLYMWEQACVCLRRWLDAGLQPVPISVNLSRMHLMNRDFLEPFIEVQKKYCIPPELLELELTETAFQDVPDAIPEAISQIHLAGYTCSLDDFGSGYSCLNNLETLDIDVLKLDCKFLQDARTEADRGHIVVEESVHMAKRLGITVCCEGVETEAQLAFLRKCHCDIGQGYLFSKPVEVAAFERMLFGDSVNI